MADGSPTVPESFTEAEEELEPQDECVRLRYPEIELTTSLDSLLTHSFPSTQASIVMRTAAAPAPALDESWASLSASEFSREDDLQSENADADSLVDLSSTQDNESVNDEDEQSEYEVDEVPQSSIITVPTVAEPVKSEETEESEQHLEDATDDTIIFRPSEHQPSTTWTHLEYTSAAHVQSISASPTGPYEIESVTHMNVANESLSTSDKPFHLAYYGIGTARLSRDELLGKIGAAIVTSVNKQDVSECYNIFPTEFGPGSKPAFAELIPSQARMAVDNVTILKPARERPKNIRFAFKHGAIFESKPTMSPHSFDQHSSRPDLVVIQLCRDDLADDFYTVKQVIELARRHCWPILVTSQDSTAELYPILCPHSLFKKTIIQASETTRIAKHPIDIDSFLRIDTDQLNKHIRYIVDVAEKRQQTSHAPASFIVRLRSSFSRFLQISTSKPQLDRWVLETVDSAEKSMVQQPGQTFVMSLKQFFGGTDYGRTFRHMAGSVAIILIWTMLISIYPSLLVLGAQRMTVSAPSRTSAFSIPNSATSMITATSVLPSATVEPSMPLVENSPGSFNHMLHHLVGKPEIEKVDIAEENPSIPMQAEPINCLEVQQDPPIGVVDKVESLLFTLVAKLNAAQDRMVERGIKLQNRRRAARARNRQQMEDLHVKVQGFWTGILEGVQDLNQQSHDSLAELVAQSQSLLAQSQKAGGRRLERLVRDQKAILLKAQQQAQNIVEQPTKSTKQQSLLGRARHVVVD